MFMTKESKSRLIKLGQLKSSSAFKWYSRSFDGYVSDDGWLHSPTRKHLLWLPPHWQSHRWKQYWQGQFFGFTHSKPSEAVILKFLE